MQDHINPAAIKSAGDNLRNRKSRKIIQQATPPPGVVFDSNDGYDDDPTTVGEAVSVLTDGYPWRYDCSRGISEPLSQVVVEFDYEYAASTDSASATGAIFDIDSLPIALPSMEWGLLWTVASDLGLHGCTVLNNWAESRESGNLSFGYTVVSLLSRPLDTLDPTTSKFQCGEDFDETSLIYLTPFPLSISPQRLLSVLGF
jgi:hypothetical protein